MKVHLALAAAVAQVTTGTSSAVFPAAGQHVSYAIHDTLPRGGAYDTTLTLAGGAAASIAISAPGKGTTTIALDNGAPAHLDRQLGMGFHLLEVANDVVQAGLAGRSSVSVRLGPPNAEPATLAIATSGDTIVASGTASLPAPPTTDKPGGPEGGPPPPSGDHQISVKIVATLANGHLSTARGEFAPPGNRGPRHTWTVSRKS